MRVLDGDGVRLATLRAMATAAGRRALVVHGRRTRAATLAAFGRDLGFPDYYGHNLDALVDCLRDLALADGPFVELIWDRAGRLAHHDPAAYQAVADALVLVESESPARLAVTLIHR